MSSDKTAAALAELTSDDIPLSLSTIAGTLWQPDEKERLFRAVARLPLYDIETITSLVKTKTTLEVATYIDTLQHHTERLINRFPELFEPLETPMSDVATTTDIVAEERMSRQINQAIETELRQGDKRVLSQEEKVMMSMFHIERMQVIAREFYFKNPDALITRNTLLSFHCVLRKWLTKRIHDAYQFATMETSLLHKNRHVTDEITLENVQDSLSLHTARYDARDQKLLAELREKWSNYELGHPEFKDEYYHFVASRLLTDFNINLDDLRNGTFLEKLKSDIDVQSSEEQQPEQSRESEVMQSSTCENTIRDATDIPAPSSAAMQVQSSSETENQQTMLQVFDQVAELNESSTLQDYSYTPAMLMLGEQDSDSDE
ncbi:hypothetical protein BKA69DRAFT_1163438 [Paraphysoderma sedebokerense]|nr:hypothetical protein BKA69DRAFT_1163438 [Paraphysoderma sedebokerense]